jgi:hypothetical protein
MPTSIARFFRLSGGRVLFEKRAGSVADAVNIFAVGNRIQVKGEDFFFSKIALQPDGNDVFFTFSRMRQALFRLPC